MKVGRINTMNQTQSVPMINNLPSSLPRDGAIIIELEGGVPVFRAAPSTQRRIERLLLRQRDSTLTPDEEQELSEYEEMDDYLSYLNRLTRNLASSEAARLTEENRAA